MKLTIANATLSDARWYPIFDVMLLFVEEKRHTIAAEQARELIHSDWLRTRPAKDRELIKLAVTRQSHDRLADRSSVLVDAEATRGGVADRGTRCTKLHPRDVIGFLAQPYAVIVENDWYDGSFLLWMAKLLGREKFIEAYRAQRFAFRNAGGKDAIARSASVLCQGVWPSPTGKRARATELWAAAILDNDSKYPAHQPNSDILTETRKHVEFVHLLRNRAIESYLPHTALRRLDSSDAFKGRIEALFRLDAIQKRHYHMKRGFRLKSDPSPDKAAYIGSNDVEPGEKALFGHVPDQDWEELASGFGKGLSRMFVEPELRPTAADRDAIDPASRDELSQLLDDIYERI